MCVSVNVCVCARASVCVCDECVSVWDEGVWVYECVCMCVWQTRACVCVCVKVTIWNRMRPSALVKNQHTRELISTWKNSHKHSNKDPPPPPQSPTVTLTWHANRYKVHKLHQRYIWWSLCTLYLLSCIYLVFTCMPGESCHRQLRSLLGLCEVFQALTNSLVCWQCMKVLAYMQEYGHTRQPQGRCARTLRASLFGTFLQTLPDLLCYWWDTLYFHAAVHRRSQCPLKGSGTDKTVEET